MFRCTNQGIHQDEKVVGPVVPFLVVEQKIHEGLFEANRRFSFISMLRLLFKGAKQ
jgi:hypothetical protein